ncbi:hypothetical protein SAMN05661093_11233 [Kibdelosporangium aridum]|uniref:Uncharacterized protein n=1 Tax=Kibdelosporangium aridum TaxID=2030 RepID=A0A1W2G0H7_KIBAR|nr:hypothetical protein SAMN05661093_11233 [Kibdelosporangium aridum]
MCKGSVVKTGVLGELRLVEPDGSGELHAVKPDAPNLALLNTVAQRNSALSNVALLPKSASVNAVDVLNYDRLAEDVAPQSRVLKVYERQGDNLWRRHQIWAGHHDLHDLPDHDPAFSSRDGGFNDDAPVDPRTMMADIRDDLQTMAATTLTETQESYATTLRNTQALEYKRLFVHRRHSTAMKTRLRACPLSSGASAGSAVAATAERRCDTSYVPDPATRMTDAALRARGVGWGRVAPPPRRYQMQPSGASKQMCRVALRPNVGRLTPKPVWYSLTWPLSRPLQPTLTVRGRLTGGSRCLR